MNRDRIRGLTALALAADVVAVVVFAAAGRATHDGPETLSGLLVTAAPFLAGVLVARLEPGVRADPAGLRSGAVVLVVTAVVGLVARAVFLDRLPVSFAVVATVSLGVALLGWRVVAAVVARTVAHRTPR